MLTSVNVLTALLGTFLVCSAVLNAFLAMSSEGYEIAFLEFLIGLPVFVVLAAFSLRATVKSIKCGQQTKSQAIVRFAAVLCSYSVASQITWCCLVPINIRFDFSYGSSGTFHRVQFHFKENGRWLDGPLVEGWPLEVSFPDLNGDGHHDIQVKETLHKGTVDIIYSPQNDGSAHWHLVKNDSQLTAMYPRGNWPF